MKTCRDCSLDKDLDDFHRSAATKDGRQGVCKKCSKIKTDLYRVANPDKIKSIAANDYAKNRSARIYSRRAYIAKNRDKINESAQRWAQENPAKVNARNSRHRAEKTQRTPAWSDVTKVNVFYAKAARLSRWLGKPFHVDHIVPLRSKVVCGLHCDSNLQILEASTNTIKGNRYWPDMQSN